MSKLPDENDRARAGTLPADPSAETERAKPPLRVVAPGEQPRGEPANVAAERALLGALLWAGANAPDTLRTSAVVDLLETGEPFYQRAHGDTYDAMRACAGAKVEHDTVAVHAELVRQGRGITLETLEKLKADASTVSEKQARAYATEIRTTWARRRLIADARLLVEAARDPKATFTSLVEQGRASIRAMSERTPDAARSVSAQDSANSFFRQLKECGSSAMATGLLALDTALNGGLRPAEVSVLAARTNVGKSALAAQIGEHMVSRDPSVGVLYITLEMSHEMFTARLVSARSGVPISNLRRKVLNPVQWSQVTAAVDILTRKGLYFADNPSQTMAAIYATAAERARLLARDGKRLAMVVIDHLGLVKPSAEALKKSNREQQVAETSRAQRVIAGELGVHVLGIAQIARESEKQASYSMPKLAHLRESGALEQDADVVMILHRERDAKTGMFRKDIPPALAIAKGRMDETSVMILGYQPSEARFFDWNGAEGFDHFYGGKS